MSSTNDDADIIEFSTPGTAILDANIEINQGPCVDSDDDETNHNSSVKIESDVETENESETTNSCLVSESSSSDDSSDNIPPLEKASRSQSPDEEESAPEEEEENVNQFTDENDALNQQGDDLFDLENIEPDAERAAQAKIRGNQAFSQGLYMDALESYAEALLFCPEELENERVLYHNNKCAAHIMIKDWEEAIFEADCVLQLSPDNTKGLARRAKSYEATERYQEAIEDYKRLIELEPRVTLYQQKHDELTKKAEEKFAEQKTEMLGKLKGWGDQFLGMFGMSTDNFQFQQDPNTGSYSVNFVQNPDGSAAAGAAAAAASGGPGAAAQSGPGATSQPFHQ